MYPKYCGAASFRYIYAFFFLLQNDPSDQTGINLFFTDSRAARYFLGTIHRFLHEHTYFLHRLKVKHIYRSQSYWQVRAEDYKKQAGIIRN